MLIVLKGSWDLVTRVIIRVTILITPIKVLITLLTKSHDPPSKPVCYTGGAFGLRSGSQHLQLGTPRTVGDFEAGLTLQGLGKVLTRDLQAKSFHPARQYETANDNKKQHNRPCQSACHYDNPTTDFSLHCMRVDPYWILNGIHGVRKFQDKTTRCSLPSRAIDRMRSNP